MWNMKSFPVSSNGRIKPSTSTLYVTQVLVKSAATRAPFRPLVSLRPGAKQADRDAKDLELLMTLSVPVPDLSLACDQDLTISAAARTIFRP